MKMSDLKDLTSKELQAKGREIRQELFNLRLQKATSQMDKPHRVRELRRSVARIETQMSALHKKTA